jgi:multidrug resistance efflux pump
MKKYVLYFLILTFLSCQDNKLSIKPNKEDITESVYASGIVKSLDQYQVFSSSNGIISEVFVKEGDIVKIGSPLFRIYSSVAKINSEQAKINAEFYDTESRELKIKELKLLLDNSRTKYLNDSILYLRQQKLWNSQIGSKLELEQRELAFVNSKNNLESNLNRYNELLKQLDLTSRQSRKNIQLSESIESDFIVKSQINGTVFSILKEKGEMASAQVPLAIIGNSDNYILELLIDEYDIAKISIGQKVIISMDSYKSKVFEGEIIRIIPLMNEKTKSFTVEAVFKKEVPKLFPNLTVEANILISEKNDAMTIPRDYLMNNEFVILKSGKKVKVKTGLKDYKKVEILGGIGFGDELIKE